MPQYQYLPEKDQWRNTDTGRFASGIDVIQEGEIQQVETPSGTRYKQKGGSFVSQKALLKREKEEKPYESVEIAERILVTDDDGTVEQIRTYSPNGEQNDKAIIRVGIEKGVISETEYNEAESIGSAADLVRERSVVRQTGMV